MDFSTPRIARRRRPAHVVRHAHKLVWGRAAISAVLVGDLVGLLSGLASLIGPMLIHGRHGKRQLP